MAVFRPRTRLVNFRLSEDEYQQLKDSCARSGARSVSDYARASVLTGAGFATASAIDSGSSLNLAAGPHSSAAGTCPAATCPAATCLEACPQRWQRLEGTVQEIQQSLHALAQQLQSRPVPLPAATPATTPASNADSPNPEFVPAEERAASHG